MADPAVLQNLIQQAVELVHASHGDIAAASRASGIPYSTLERRFKKSGQPKPSIKSTTLENRWSESGDTASFTGTFGYPIRTEKQLCEACDVDLKVWEVTHLECRAWTTSMKLKTPGKDGKSVSKPHGQQNFAVSARFRRRYPRRLETAIDLLVDRIPKFKFPKPVTSRLKADPHMLEIGLYDVHFGKLAWAMETGENYDLKIAENCFRHAIEELLADTAAVNIEKILLPIGQDFLHFDNLIGMSTPTTTNGTPQDVDGRWAKVFEVATAAMIWGVETCLKRGPVQLAWVPGNHDHCNSFWVAKVVQERFRGCKDVTVDIGPQSRKYVHYGTSLLGMTHGDCEKHADLPTIMATEQPHAWSSSLFHIWHVGHFHKKKETRFISGDTYGSVQVVVLPSMAGRDAWHYSRGLIGAPRSCEAYLWSKTRGPRAHFTSAVLN